MLYFPLTPHHGWHRSIPANDFRQHDFRVPDWREWVSKLDEGSFELTVLYPTRFMHIGQIGNPPYAIELCRAYNDFLHDRFLIHDQRFRGMALLPLQDPAAAVKELRRAVNNYGMLGGILPAEGLPLPLGHRQYWPVFHAADKLGCTLSIHSCNSLRDNDRYLVPNEAATLTHVIPQMRQFTSLMFSGVLTRLADFRLGEIGASPAPFVMRPGLRQPAREEQCQCQAAVRAGVAGVERQGFFVTTKCLVDAVELDQRDAEITPGAAVLRIASSGLNVMLNRFSRSTVFRQRQGQVEMRLRIRRPQVDRTAKASHGFVGAAGEREGNAQLALDVGVRRVS